MPGPGEYPLDDSNDLPSYSLRFRTKIKTDFDRKPGPNSYKLPSTLDDHSYTIGYSERPPLWEGSAGLIGPGEYPLRGAVGKQVVSNYETLPSYSFQKDGKQDKPKVKGGPIYEIKYPTAIGKQLLSKYKTMPSVSLSGRTAFGSIYGW